MAPNAITAMLEIRPARGAEVGLARRMVPEVFKAAIAPDRVLIARSPGDPQPIGVAAIAWRPWGTPAGFPVHVLVTERARRNGVGRALVRAAAELCRADAERFHAWDAVDEGSGAACFAHALGFTPHRRTLYYEADLAACGALIGPIHERLRGYGAIPQDATVVSLREAPAQEVARLVSDAFGSRYDAMLASVAGQHCFDVDLSFVLLHDGAVGGALLQRFVGGVQQVEVSVVAPALQCGWAVVVLLREAVCRGLAAGGHRFGFRCEDSVRDTVNLARRVGARLARTAVEYSAPVAALL
jgi:GNAT superfamily N-acetyltransferase